MYNKLVRKEVMGILEKEVSSFLENFLTPIEKIWQPSDFLPDPSSESFKYDLEEIQTFAREMPYDLFVTLIGDCITEEALPSYMKASSAASSNKYLNLGAQKTGIIGNQ